ncbi:GGDEF domain-containing protein [Nocardioides mangrovicus]|uniref:GGDEF domain-containing protein n=1 Tax=Nocardioides mangrovicus TaxID=2478913 RepID=A0A3L8P041_9ACTN|nr:GGDEF domain-containing protein [Nocardioides mangrovicus]RLV48544.1 GGDEF domain-containing protein [Nocardioides mangrovicus]
MSRRALLLVALLTLFVLLPPALRGPVQAVVELTCLALCVLHLRARPELHRSCVVVLLAGVTITVLGDAAFFLAPLVGRKVPYDVGDLVLVVGYAVIAAGTLGIARLVSRTARRSSWLDAGIFGLGTVAPVLVFLVLPDAQRLLGWSTLLTAAYAASLVLLGTALARLLLTRTDDPTAVVLLGLAGSMTIATDFVVAVLGTGSRLQPGAQVPWLLCYLVLTAAVRHPSFVAMFARPSSRTNLRRSVRLLSAGLVVPPGSLVLALVLGYRHVWAIAGVALVVSLLAAQRLQALVVHVERQNVELGDLARSDELTGLPNRRSWNHELPRACAEADATGSGIAFAMLDLDRFKDYNDSFGHQAGDDLLRATARRWQAALRPGEFLARYGGEEFVLLLRGVDVATAAERVETLRRLVAEPATASAGFAMWRPGADPAWALARADRALYRAKGAGRDRTVAADRLAPVRATCEDLVSDRPSREASYP